MADFFVQPQPLRTTVVLAFVLSAATNLCRAPAEDPPAASRRASHCWHHWGSLSVKQRVSPSAAGH
ncbi:MAG UNVERIFIED_CONTAM: hypothetical protein LVR18_26320 [Planctomycetaceae bacterium]|jgi:hypothetical protein